MWRNTRDLYLACWLGVADRAQSAGANTTAARLSGMSLVPPPLQLTCRFPSQAQGNDLSVLPANDGWLLFPRVATTCCMGPPPSQTIAILAKCRPRTVRPERGALAHFGTVAGL